MLFLFKEHTLSLRAVEHSNSELPDISDLLTAYTIAASKPQGGLAKQPTQTTPLLSNDRADLLFIIHASSSHDHDQTFIITLTMCGAHAKSWISALCFAVCFCLRCALSSGKMCLSLQSILRIVFWHETPRHVMRADFSFSPVDLDEMLSLSVADD